MIEKGNVSGGAEMLGIKVRKKKLFIWRGGNFFWAYKTMNKYTNEVNLQPI